MTATGPPRAATPGASQLPAPRPGLLAVVVVPAHDEEARIGACVAALGDQEGLRPDDFEILLVLDRCGDATLPVARRAAERAGVRLLAVGSTQPGSGPARALGMRLAHDRLAGKGDDGLIATTDADSRVARDWLVRQLELVAQGARAIGGRIELDPDEAAELPPAVLDARRRQAEARMARLASGPPSDPGQAPAGHHQFSGASLGLTTGAFRAVRGVPAATALEDEALQRALEERGISIVRSAQVRVTTSARTDGRSPRGLSQDLALERWRALRSFPAGHFDAGRLARGRRQSVSVVLPARETAQTIGGILDTLAGLRRMGLLDEILVIDADSTDGTAEVAAAHGATVHQEDALLPHCGPSLGKGDAMWRGLSVARGDIVVYLDADTEDFNASFVTGLLGPLLTDAQVSFVKGAFRRPLRVGDRTLPGEGGRVTELVARPLLNLHMPELAGFDQPLAGEVAAPASLLRRLPFPCGYGVEIAMLIDTARLIGVDAMAQVDLGQRQNRHGAAAARRHGLRDHGGRRDEGPRAGVRDSGCHGPPAARWLGPHGDAAGPRARAAGAGSPEGRRQGAGGARSLRGGGIAGGRGGGLDPKRLFARATNVAILGYVP